MNHTDHVNLLKPAQLPEGGAWADFGAGAGAFTLALRELVGPQAQIYAIDNDRSSLNQLRDAYKARFGDEAALQVLLADFSRPLELPPLDGALMANSLHFFRNKEKILTHVRSFIKPDAALLLVEYNVDVGNPWVPYPLSFDTWRVAAPPLGFAEPRLLATHPSHFLREIYSAMTRRKEN